jgi:hypothetical protein
VTKQDDSGGPAKPKERQERFEPVQILLVPSGDEWNLVAQDATGAQTGVLCPPAAIDSLRTFVSSPNPHFVEIWRTYERSMGPSVFFWDIVALAEALQDLGDVLDVRRLLRFRSAGELCHNKWQARLMRLARFHGLDPVMIRAEPDRRRADFHLRSEIDVEVKTLFNETSIDISNKAGTRISIEDADKFALGVRRKAADAEGQLSDHGIVVVATWCDLTANYMTTFPGVVPIQDIRFEPGTAIVALAPSVGDIPEVGITVDRDRIDELCEAAAHHLYKSQDMPIPLTGRLAGATRGTTWMSIGRCLRTAAIGAGYGAYQINRARFRDDLFTDPERKNLAQGLAGLKAVRDRWNALNTANPIAGGLYSPDQLNSDPRFHTLFSWGASLCNALVYIATKRALADLLPLGQPRDDAERFLRAVFRPDGPISAEGLLRLEHALDIMGRLTQHVTKTASLRLHECDSTLPGHGPNDT